MTGVREVPFLHDFMDPLTWEEPWHLPGLLWSYPVAGPGSVRVVPGSPEVVAREVAAEWGGRPDPDHRFADRLWSLVEGLLRDLPEVDEVLVDCPPGMAGWSRRLRMLAAIAGGRQPPFPGRMRLADHGIVCTDQILVIISPNRGELAVALRHWLRDGRGRWRLVVNRWPFGDDVAGYLPPSADSLRQTLGPMLRIFRIAPNEAWLGRLFIGDPGAPTAARAAEVMHALDLPEAR